MDKITLQRIELLHPKLREEAKAIYKEICEALTGKAICRFTHTLRTFKEQDELYTIGRTKKGRRVTNAKGGQSYHNYGLAIDICLLVDKDNNGTYETAVWDTKADFDNDKVADWQEIVAIFKRYGWTWGGDWRFTDPPHFQKTFGKSIADLQGLYNRQKTEYVSF
ncbi:M15 family metallopeptidase [Riemerella anatipestifer]|uniref:M15 family metallopeptidase n=1 Tax=Riemerella anatipestifer TaxID=34085 RepID=A0AAP3EUK6_RIEAN|nr:M15 family metallopeptidase [Riemerella anatipestifer]MBT0572791.1 M15 family metallopeptidase [Riemerella anatipestifer]MCE3024533.1 M15 family metallopeptidase [Riemerella anatipestifer]MCU7558688.1 M15 family metallopeptidase [Riemerella anatipestifer]MCU7568326.1 M15 family metallopeptidase [Riemerella anatipestifer]MCW0489320.1 M15 family metallopeptidase [Riemerella anatipestifer]